jgi:prepilin peptidase CpaA
LDLAVLAPHWAVYAFFALLALAALQDSVQLKISNLICGAVLLLAIVAAVAAGPSLALWQNLLVFALALAVGTWLFGRGVLGGGDVKLFAVTGLWFDLGSAAWLLLAVAIAGGVLAIIIIVLRFIGWPETWRARVKVLQPRAGIPYGIAIAGGAALAVAMLERSAGLA